VRGPAAAATRPIPSLDPTRLRQAMEEINGRSLPAELEHWAGEYAKVGHRNAFLWKWCQEGVSLTTLPCVDPALREVNIITKVLGVMLDVLLDDVADRSTDDLYLDRLLRIPFAKGAPDFSEFTAPQQAYAEATRRVWQTIESRASAYRRFEEFRHLWRFDYAQVFNAMRFSQIVNRDPLVLNMVEHDHYSPHNMHMMVSGTLDLMCSSGFDHNELGLIRQVLWHGQCMGRIGNLVTTWEREVGDRDFTSGVFARTVEKGDVTARELVAMDADGLREAVRSAECEDYFLSRWSQHRDQIVDMSESIQSVNVLKLVRGLEQLIQLHLGSRGLK